MIDSLIEPLTSLLDKFVPDRDQRDKLAHDIATMASRHEQERALAQVELNKVEAKSSSRFTGGWRPFIGWVCGATFAYHYVLQPFLVFAVTVVGADTPELPTLDIAAIMGILTGMLGISGSRTFEKLRGVNS